MDAGALQHCQGFKRMTRCEVVLAPFAISILLQDWQLEMLNGGLVHLLLPLAEALLLI